MKTMADIPVAILAGGLGTRLRPAVSNVPKAMADINGKPFLRYLLEWLLHQGTRQVIICTGYRGEQIQEYFSDHYGPVRLHYSHEKKAMGTAGALRQCAHLLNGEHVLAINGDTFCPTDLNAFAVWHQRKPFNASVLLARKDNADRFGSVETDHRGYIVRFHEKAVQSGSGYVSAGIYLFKHSVVASIPNGQIVSMEYEVLPGLIGKGLSGYKSDASFIDIGTPESYDRAQHYFQHYPMGIRSAANSPL